MARSFALLALVAAFSAASSAAASSSSVIRGIPRSLYAAYEGPTFTCLDKSKTVALSAVNDDFCDCPDGSDEPGTSACPNARFYCTNKGFRGKYLPSMYVNDGVCDCCDGSDEHASRAKCANTCDVDGAAWRASQADGIKRAEEGAVRRLAYAKEGQDAAAARKTRLAEMAAKLDVAKKVREAAEAAVAKAEEGEKAETEARRAAAGAGEGAGGAASSGDGTIADALGIAGLDKAGLLGLLIEHVKGTGTSEKLVELVRSKGGAGLLSGYPASGFEAKWVGGDNEGGAAAPAAAEEDFKSEAGNAARAALATAKSDEGKLNGDLSALKEEDGGDYGPDAAFFKLKDACTETKAGPYTYKVCPFGRASQDSTHLGTFSGWKKAADGVSSDYSTMLFSGGTSCWNGPARSFTLTFECGMTETLTNIDEPEKCTYAGKMTTPAACDDRAARELRLELDAPEGAAPPARGEEL
jgi:protein kinase C substrate 80K-H